MAMFAAAAKFYTLNDLKLERLALMTSLAIAKVTGPKSPLIVVASRTTWRSGRSKVH